MPIQQKNTKSHWTALAIARYYDQYGTACRVRDLYEYMDVIHDEPDHLSAMLYRLKDSGTVDYITVKSPSRSGGNHTTFAYYPTPITIETLRDIGEPDKMPDGSPVPDDIDTSLTTARVAAEDDVKPPENIDRLGLRYQYSEPRDVPDELRRTYDTSNLEQVDYSLVEDESADEPDLPASEGPEPDLVEFDGAGNVDTDLTPSNPGQLARSVDWTQVARDLESRAQRAADAGLHDIATAYSQFATRAVENDLDRRTAFMLLGTPVLDIEADAPEART